MEAGLIAVLLVQSIGFGILLAYLHSGKEKAGRQLSVLIERNSSLVKERDGLTKAVDEIRQGFGAMGHQTQALDLEDGGLVSGEAIESAKKKFDEEQRRALEYTERMMAGPGEYPDEVHLS